MKKLTLIMAFVVLGMAASAQSINVSNAYEQQNRGYYKKAMGFIDQAVQHEQTSTSAQAWFYRTLIYCKIGGEIKNQTKKGKELEVVAANWYREAYISVLNWQQFDKTGEYTDKITPFIPYIGNVYYDLADNAFKKQEYDKTIAYCDTAIQLFNMGAKANLPLTWFLAGAAAQNSGNNELVKKYFNYLVRNKYDDNQVYETLFNVYSTEKDTVNAMKVAAQFKKAFPAKYEAEMLMARGYLMNGNLDKSRECMMSATSKVGDDINKKAALLCQIAQIYEVTNEYAEAESKYNESLTLVSNQFGANYNMGKMFYNRAVDKLDAANNVDPNDETGLYDKLNDEAKALFGQTVLYFNNAIAFIDGLPEDQKKHNQANLYNCLNALKTVYLRLEMTDKFTETNNRLNSLNVGK